MIEEYNILTRSKFMKMDISKFHCTNIYDDEWIIAIMGIRMKMILNEFEKKYFNLYSKSQVRIANDYHFFFENLACYSVEKITMSVICTAFGYEKEFTSKNKLNKKNLKRLHYLKKAFDHYIETINPSFQNPVNGFIKKYKLECELLND